jgi:hypothetical protein
MPFSFGVIFVHSPMQNRYTADVGDFGKYALLNALAGRDLRLGVMWYLNSVEESNADGRFTFYPGLRPCDPVLHRELAQVLENEKRNLSEIETRRILPSGTLFYRAPLPYPPRPCFTAATKAHQQELREQWFRRGVHKLRAADLVFCDPDNGVAGTRARKYNRKSIKYVFVDEITDWLHRGQSVVVYQHQRRMPLENQISEQLREFGEYRSSGWALSFHRQSLRVYFVLPATESHRAMLRERSDIFLGSQWGQGGHFR